MTWSVGDAGYNSLRKSNVCIIHNFFFSFSHTIFLYEIEIELKTFSSQAMNLQETQHLKLDFFFMNYCDFFSKCTLL